MKKLKWSEKGYKDTLQDGIKKEKGRLLLFTYPNYIYCTAKIQLSFDREKFQKKFERGRTKAENQPYRGGGDYPKCIDTIQ